MVVAPVPEPAFTLSLIHIYPFERTLDASTFVAVTKTYGGNYASEQLQAIEQIINEDFGGFVTKAEDAALYLSMRL